MIERNKITISLLPNDYELWDFIQHKKEICNISEYIRGLIQRDMTNPPSIFAEEKIVERILQAFLNNKIILPEKNSRVTEEMILNDETKNTILSLF